MSASENKRQPLVWGGLVLTLAATAWVAASENVGQEELLVKPGHRVSPAVVTGDGGASAEVLAYRPRALIVAEPEDLFPVEALPDEVAETLPPPKPTTPTLPFSYAGKLVEDGNALVFLIDGNRNLAVRTGDVIDGVWRIESIRPPTIILAYLPLKTVVPLVIGETN